MDTQLGIMTVLGMAASVSLLAGWRLYLCILATALAMRWHIVPLPEHLQSLRVLASGWVIGAAGFAALCEFFADKVPWLDSLWDSVHTAVRPVGGALLAAAIVDPADPRMQVVAFILGGGGALLAHTSKAGTRALVNLSPEPFSNIALSTAEDATSSGLLYLVYGHPYSAVAVAVGMVVVTGGLLLAVWKIIGRVFHFRKSTTISRPPSI